MDDNVYVHLMCDENYCLQLEIECPSCHDRQPLPLAHLGTGIGFFCACGDEFPISVAALHPVQQELTEVRHLLNKSIKLPI